MKRCESKVEIQKKGERAHIMNEKCFNNRDSRDMTCLVTLNAGTLAWRFSDWNSKRKDKMAKGVGASNIDSKHFVK